MSADRVPVLPDGASDVVRDGAVGRVPGPPDGASGPRPELTDRFAELLAAASLARAILRREARGLCVWALGLGLLCWYSVVALRETYGTPELRLASGVLQSTPGVAAFTGPGLGMEGALAGVSPSLEAIVANEVLLYVALGASVYAILLVVRHTRATEENGQAELVRAGALRRGAEGAVVLLVLDIALTALGLAVLLGLLAGGVGAVGAVLFAGAGMAAGAVLAGVALLLAQLAPSARSARALSLLILLAAFETRAVGDVLRASDMPGSWISLLSPLGWAQAAGPWTVNRWWWILIATAVADLLLLAGARVSARRDVGSPAIALPEPPGADRPGPRGPLALAWRTRGGAAAWWVLGAAVLGALYGSLTGSIETSLAAMIRDSPYLSAFLGGSLTARSFLALVMLVLDLVGLGAGVALIVSGWHEEVSGRADVLVVAPRPRATRLVASLVVAALGSLAALVVGAGCLGGGGALTVGDPTLLRDALLAALGAWPACLVLIGASALLTGLGRAAGSLAWAVYGLIAAMAVFSDLLGLPQWLRDLTPLEHAPRVLALGLGADGVSWLGALVMTVAGCLLAAIGVWLTGRRDLR